MAERYAVATGNWSAVGTWDGGATLPTTGDDVHANTYTVTIDQDVTVGTLRTTAGATAAAGGSFIVSGSRTITADTYAGSTTCLTMNAAGQVLVGNSFGSDSTSFSYGVKNSAAAVHTGNSTGGSATGGYGSNVIEGGTQNGNATGGSGSSAFGANVDKGGVLNGNATGGPNAWGANVKNGSKIIGNTTGGTATNAYGANLSNGGIHFGDATGSATNSAPGTYVTTGGIAEGVCTGGGTSGAHGVKTVQHGTAIHCTLATGATSGAFGVSSAGSWGIVVIDSESGTYPKSLDSKVDTTTDNMPFFAASGGGGLLEPGSMNGGMV